MVARVGHECPSVATWQEQPMPRPTRARPHSAVAGPTALLTASGVRDDWSDCQRLPGTPSASKDPAEWARRLFHDPPPWVAAALSLRDRVVGSLGLRPASSDAFRVLAQSEE